MGEHLGGLSPVAWQATAAVEDDKLVEVGPCDYNEIVTTKEAETIDAFPSQVIHMKMKTAHQGEDISVMTQSLCVEDGSLPQGLMVQNAYTELHNGSKNFAVAVRNSMAYPQTLGKKTPIARAVVVTWIPEIPLQISLTEPSEENHDHWAPKLNVKQRQERLFEELDLSGLESWLPKLVAATQSLLAEYHDVFSLEPSEPGCTHSTKHVINVTNDTPFKE